LRRNLKETSYTFTDITNAPLAIRVNRTFTYRDPRTYETAYTQRETDLYNLVAFVCPFKLPSQLSGVLDMFAKSSIITMHVQWKRITLCKIVYRIWQVSITCSVSLS